MLFGKRYADDGDGQKQTEQDVHQPCPKTTKYHPEDVQRDTDASNRAIGGFHTSTEGPQAKETKFEGLQGNRYTHNGNSQGKGAREIADGSLKTSQQQPKYVSYKTHDIM